MVRRTPRGRSSYGCLLTLAVIGAAVYFALNAGRVYLRYFEYQDAMAQEARFAASKDDDVIVGRLRAKADSLGLPEAAKRIHIRRQHRQVFIWSDYVETIELPGFVRDVDFTPHVERAF
jgi:hypothetical protein